MKRQVVSFLLETKHKVFRFKTKPIPRMPVQDPNSSLKILVANAQLSVCDQLGPKKYGGGSLFSIFGVFVFKTPVETPYLTTSHAYKSWGINEEFPVPLCRFFDMEYKLRFKKKQN